MIIPPKFRASLNPRFLTFLACGAAVSMVPSRLDAAAYASGFVIENNTVKFTLNEPADVLSVSINGGPAIFLDATTAGEKSFTRSSASDTFSVTAIKNDPIGYTIPTGGIIAKPTLNGLTQDTAAGGFRLISDDSNPLTRFNSPRGVAVATNPNNPYFGTTYISNSTVGTVSGVGRGLGDGYYALKADQTDAFGFGDIAQQTGFEGTASGSSPFRLSVGADHNIYIADFSDSNGGVYRMSGALTGGTQVLAGIGGPLSGLPAGQNHGSTTAVVVSGSANGDLTLYTLDEDLTSAHLETGTSTGDKNSVWRYDIGSSELPFSGVPTKINQTNVLVPEATSDMERGLNGNFYLAQNRANGNEAGIVVLSPDGQQLFNSLAATRELLGISNAKDIFSNVMGIAISLDQGYLAVMLNNSDIAVMTLNAEGIPDIASRLVIDTGADIISGRDIAFDAAGNIHYVSSGQARYRVLARGGYTEATTSFDGDSYEFVVVPEPSTAMLIGSGMFLFLRRRRARGC